MTIQTRISFREYAKLLFSLTYRKPMMKVILFVAVVMLAWIIDYYSHLILVPKPQIYQYITLGLITIAQPTVIYSTIWKNYHSSCQLKEPLEIEVDTKEIMMKGESFYTELHWSKIYKVQELKNWFLLYQNNLSAVIIPKKSLDQQQQREFVVLLKSIPSVPVHLRS